MTIYINPHSRQQLEAMHTHMPQCLLVHAQQGIGAKTIMSYFLTHKDNEIFTIQPDDKNNISIEQIRLMQQQITKKSVKRQYIIIDRAHLLSVQAQNSLLKSLEEPQKNVYFILITFRPSGLLATVRSRAQKIELLPISLDESRSLIKKKGITDTKKVEQLLFIAQGLPSELTRLIQDEIYFQRVLEAITKARNFLQSNRYQRCVQIQELSKTRETAQEFIAYCLRMLSFSYFQNPADQTIRHIEKFLDIETALEQNANVKLQLLKTLLK